MMSALAALLLASSTSNERPRLIGSVALVPFTSLFEGPGATATVHLIPFVDVEAGLFGPPAGVSWFARAGPRYLLVDTRDAEQRGFTLRVGARFGFKRLRTLLAPDTDGFNFAGCLDFTHFFHRHFGLGLHLAGGGTVELRRDVPGQTPYRRSVPELRAALALSF